MSLFSLNLSVIPEYTDNLAKKGFASVLGKLKRIQFWPTYKVSIKNYSVFNKLNINLYINQFHLNALNLKRYQLQIVQLLDKISNLNLKLFLLLS